MAPNYLSRLAGVLGGAFGQSMPRASPFKEQGSAGTPIYRGFISSPEKNPAWIGSNRYKTADEIVTNISIVAASVHYFLNLCAHPQWSVKPKDENDKEAVELAEFVDEVFHSCYTPFSRIVRRSGMYRFHGFSVQEWIAIKREDGRIGLSDIEARPQHTIEQWDITDDGTMNGVWQRSPQTNELLGLPRGKIVYLVEDTLTDSPDGLGIFRHLAEPYSRFKQYLELEAKAFERDLRGIPIGRAPLTQLARLVDAGQLEKAKYDEMIKGLEDFIRIEMKKSDTGLLLDSQPYESTAADGPKIAAAMQWGLELLTGGGNGLSELAGAIDRLQREMARIIGTEHLMMGDQGGNRALAVDKSRNLYLIANGVVGNIAAGYQKDIIDPLWDLNAFPEDKKPELKVEDVAFKDVDEVAGTLQKMAMAGAVLAPDDEAINDVRDLLGISHAPDPSPEMMGAFHNPQTTAAQTAEATATARFGGQPGKPNNEKTAQPSKPSPGDNATRKRTYSYSKYSPDQARDEHGRFASGGGGGSEVVQNDIPALPVDATPQQRDFRGRVQNFVATEKAIIGRGVSRALTAFGIGTSYLMALDQVVSAISHFAPFENAAVTAAIYYGTDRLMNALGISQDHAKALLHAGVHEIVLNYYRTRFAEHVSQTYRRDPDWASFYHPAIPVPYNVHGLTAPHLVTLDRIGKALADDDVMQSMVAFERALAEDINVNKFNPDQPRDEHGRWTSGGGGGATTSQLGPPPSGTNWVAKVQDFIHSELGSGAILHSSREFFMHAAEGTIRHIVQVELVKPIMGAVISTVLGASPAVLGAAVGSALGGPVGAAVGSIVVQAAAAHFQQELVKSLHLTPAGALAFGRHAVRGLRMAYIMSQQLDNPSAAFRGAVGFNSSGMPRPHLLVGKAALDPIEQALMMIEAELDAQGALPVDEFNAMVNAGLLPAERPTIKTAGDIEDLTRPKPNGKMPSRFVETGVGLIIEHK